MGVIKLFDTAQTKPVPQHNILWNEKKLPISFIKDFLFFFDVLPEDLPKLISFSKELEKNRQFATRNKKKFNSLTDKEKEVFILVINGKSSHEIAKILFIETSTVSTHRKRIKQKLNLKSIFDWYQYAKAFELM
ncbi:helix-turn-helix domain-containing protein [Polaribacter sp. IC073]|uniref:helix-turn-helix domain-containing protein n=1 Tax=Polaribacter sp. IC073 TaxID=2508540 RepID=UPI0011BEFBF8|nr:helix-turn-helix transcriptional regulator [Polaribacter sp. IC073]TXD49094.1 helix-turn-helix transcriptional regulator [Polaribacter sp. IC073]